MSAQTKSPQIWDDDDDWQDDSDEQDESVIQVVAFGEARRSIEQIEEERMLKRALFDPFDEMYD